MTAPHKAWRLTLVTLTVLTGAASVVAAIVFTGCGFGVQVPTDFAPRAERNCEAPPGSLIRTKEKLFLSKENWDVSADPQSEKLPGAKSLPIGTVLRVVRLTNTPAGMVMVEQNTADLVVESGPHKGKKFSSGFIIRRNYNAAAANAGYRYVLDSKRAEVVSRADPAESKR